VESLWENAGIPKTDFEIVDDFDADRIGVARMLKELVARSKAQRVLFIGDDCTAEKDLLKNALEAMKQIPDEWGLVAINDHFSPSNHATHFLADKRLLPFLNGEFFSTTYRHCFCDNELSERCIELGRFIWVENASIIHNNPIVTRRWSELDSDLDYRRVYRPDNFLHDQRLFLKRKASKWQQ
jgi:hypothetical protein